MMGEFERTRRSSKNLPASNLLTLFPRFFKPRTTAGFGPGNADVDQLTADAERVGESQSAALEIYADDKKF
jgi:hypothetical protein